MKNSAGKNNRRKEILQKYVPDVIETKYFYYETSPRSNNGLLSAADMKSADQNLKYSEEIILTM